MLCSCRHNKFFHAISENHVLNTSHCTIRNCKCNKFNLVSNIEVNKDIKKVTTNIKEFEEVKELNLNKT